MKLTGVTLTGADDSVDPSELLKLSKEFPFVEWGILIGSHGGVPRFPSHDWFASLATTIANEKATIELSLHICGSVLRNIMSEAVLFVSTAVEQSKWRRTQLNFHGAPVPDSDKDNIEASLLNDWISEEVIVQLDGVNNWLLYGITGKGLPKMSGLYDCSHGAGVTPDEWPVANANWNIGYAGGLGPDNIGIELPRVAAAADDHPFWIDMETKLRSDDDRVFDLAKCRSVLEQVREITFNSQLICRR